MNSVAKRSVEETRALLQNAKVKFIYSGLAKIFMTGEKLTKKEAETKAFKWLQAAALTPKHIERMTLSILESRLKGGRTANLGKRIQKLQRKRMR